MGAQDDITVVSALLSDISSAHSTCSLVVFLMCVRMYRCVCDNVLDRVRH